MLEEWYERLDATIRLAISHSDREGRPRRRATHRSLGAPAAGPGEVIIEVGT